ncbi:hypothetical protein MPSEU_000190300 [Mayamaea pseudoterrestris]|nr:hypothetical protein MPSEU_000190300 [Mayamaea pseudoterrestris]
MAAESSVISSSKALQVLATTSVVITILFFCYSSRIYYEISPNDGPSSAFPPHLYHQSSPFALERACIPKRLHLAQRSNLMKNEDDDSYSVNMTISFQLDFDACRNVAPIVVYGRGVWIDGTILVRADERKQFNYTSDKSQGLYKSDWIYHVELPHLQAGRVAYWYQILVKERINIETDGATLEQRRLRNPSLPQQRIAKSNWYTFFTPPLPHMPTKLALVGDLGQTINSTKTMHHIWRGTSGPGVPISHVLIAGDMSYADTDPIRWNSWFDLMDPLLRSTPLHVAAGNHEVECDTSNLQPFVPYENYFYNPNRIQDAYIEAVTKEYKETLWRRSCATPSEFTGTYDYGNSFYSYQHGLAHIIVLNSYSNTSKGSVQYDWLEHELRFSINRSLTPWVIVPFHSPLYTTFVGHVNEKQSLNMKQAMEPLLCKYGVNLVISGHDHGYMRTHSLTQDGQVDPSGESPVYLTLGAGGNREHHAPGYRNQEQEEWVAVRSLVDYGYGSLLLRNATHASFTWVRNGVDAGGVHDLVWLENKHYVP